jgi:Mn-containing catalase
VISDTDSYLSFLVRGSTILRLDAREVVGYLLVRGSGHIVAYAKAIEALSGVEIGKLLPIPEVTLRCLADWASLQQLRPARQTRVRSVH